MVARLKLKGIDGRAPPGVNYLLLTASDIRNASMTATRHARSSHCGKFSAIQPVLPSIDKAVWPAPSGLGYGKNGQLLIEIIRKALYACSYCVLRD